MIFLTAYGSGSKRNESVTNIAIVVELIILLAFQDVKFKRNI